MALNEYYAETAVFGGLNGSTMTCLGYADMKGYCDLPNELGNQFITPCHSTRNDAQITNARLVASTDKLRRTDCHHRRQLFGSLSMVASDQVNGLGKIMFR